MSVSPEPSDTGDAIKSHEQIAFRFCRECANLLYPREDKTNPSALLFECRTCAHSEPATTSCIFRNKLNDSVGETAGVIQDVGQDPTLPRSNKTCPACRKTGAVFFQSQQRSADTGMKLFYVCVSCGHIFEKGAGET